MSHFQGRRFLRLLCNDLLNQWRNIWIATLALAGIGLIVYLYVFNLDPRVVGDPELYRALFSVALIGGGLSFTSTIFADLHDPLQRSYFLTLPCSNLERFLSRYVLSAPLFYVYVLVVYAVFDWVAALLANAVIGIRPAAFAPFEPWMLQVTLTYFVLHALMFGGAIYFRSHALIKTSLAVGIIWFAMVLTQLVALRVFYWDHFTTFLPVASAMPTFAFVPGPTAMMVARLLLALWVLLLSFQCLREHEVQREL